MDTFKRWHTCRKLRALYRRNLTGGERKAVSSRAGADADENEVRAIRRAISLVEQIGDIANDHV